MDRITHAKTAFADKRAIDLVIETRVEAKVIGWTRVARWEANTRRGDLSNWLAAVLARELYRRGYLVMVIARSGTIRTKSDGTWKLARTLLEKKYSVMSSLRI